MNITNDRYTGILAVCAILGLHSSPLVADGAPPVKAEAETRCRLFLETDFSTILDAPTQLTKTQWVEAQDATPAYCQVEGYVSPQVGFDLRLPAQDWNGKFVHVGCGAHCGRVRTDSACPLERGYACITSDMGHKGTGDDGIWAINNLQTKVDWGFRATHVVTVAGKAIVEQYYRQAPRHSYFMGCSTGGRQALQAAQRFPWDFDGIIAGAPPIDLSLLYMDFAWVHRALHGPNGERLLNQEHLQLLAKAAVEKCDLDDGVKDGIIGHPLKCAFDPAILACSINTTECLTSAQVDAAQKIYGGSPAMRNGQLRLTAPLPGSEGSWRVSERLTLNGFRYLFFWSEAGTALTLNDLDFDRDYKRLGLMQSLVDSSNPDLRKFKAAGGKLLMYQGLNDRGFPRPTIDYYETVERTMGGRKVTQDFMRLFLLPGVDHCSGGVGADAADFLGHLEAWVEHGHAPDRIVTGHFKEPQPFAYPYQRFPSDASKLSFTRPVYPYPLRAKYRGSGNPNDANSFRALTP